MIFTDFYDIFDIQYSIFMQSPQACIVRQYSVRCFEEHAGKVGNSRFLFRGRVRLEAFGAGAGNGRY